jgi:hypothetical protein
MPNRTKNPSDQPRVEPSDPKHRDSEMVSGEIDVEHERPGDPARRSSDDDDDAVRVDDDPDLEVDEDEEDTEIEEIDLDDLSAMEGPDV